MTDFKTFNLKNKTQYFCILNNNLFSIKISGHLISATVECAWSSSNESKIVNLIWFNVLELAFNIKWDIFDDI